MDVTVVVNADGACDHMEEHYGMTGTEDGVDHLVLMTDSPDYMRLFSFDVAWGGALHFDVQDDHTKVSVLWRPLRRGDYHEVAVWVYPPDDVQTTHWTALHKNARWVYRLQMPPEIVSAFEVYAIDGWPPHLDNLYRDFCKRLTATSNGVFTHEWKELEVGCGYGLFWVPVE